MHTQKKGRKTRNSRSPAQKDEQESPFDFGDDLLELDEPPAPKSPARQKHTRKVTIPPVLRCTREVALPERCAIYLQKPPQTSMPAGEPKPTRPTRSSSRSSQATQSQENEYRVAPATGTEAPSLNDGGKALAKTRRGTKAGASQPKEESDDDDVPERRMAPSNRSRSARLRRAPLGTITA